MADHTSSTSNENPCGLPSMEFPAQQMNVYVAKALEYAATAPPRSVDEVHDRALGDRPYGLVGSTMVTTDEQFQAWFLLQGNGRAQVRRVRHLPNEVHFYDRGSPEGEFEFDADVDVHGEYNEQRDRHKDTVKMWDKANEKYELLRAELIRKAPAADKALLTAMVPSPT